MSEDTEAKPEHKHLLVPYTPRIGYCAWKDCGSIDVLDVSIPSLKHGMMEERYVYGLIVKVFAGWPFPPLRDSPKRD